MSVLRDKCILQTMRGVLRYYEGRVGRDRINPSPPQTNQLRAQARWTYLNRRGHHPYVPYVSHHNLNSNRGGFTPWIDAPPRNDPRSRLVTVCVTNQPSTNRPVGCVRPRIRVPDSAHNTDLETISESDLADDVGMNGEGGFLDGWEDGAVDPGS